MHATFPVLVGEHPRAPHATFMVHLLGTARVLSHPDLAPTESKPLGGKRRSLAMLGSKISTPCTLRQVLPLTNIIIPTSLGINTFSTMMLLALTINCRGGALLPTQSAHSCLILSLILRGG